MRKRSIILAGLYLILLLTACSNSENDTADTSLRLEITPNTVRYDKLNDTYINVSLTNVSDKDVLIDLQLPSFTYYDGDSWIGRTSYQVPLIKNYIWGETYIKPNETIELHTKWATMLKKQEMTFEDLFELFSTFEMQDKASGAPTKPRLYKLGMHGENRTEYWYAEFTVTPPLSQVILRYALISAAVLVALLLLLFFLRRKVGRTIPVSRGDEPDPSSS